MAELVDVAKTWKKKSAQAIYPGIDSALAKFTGKRSIKNFKKSTAFKTGNLLTKFVQSNSDNSMIATKMRSATFFTYELVLDIAPAGAAPEGAEYGKYVHNGTRKMGERPYAKIGAQQPEVKQIIDDFLSGLAKNELQKYKDILDATFAKLN
jgi:hypothetical protein